MLPIPCGRNDRSISLVNTPGLTILSLATYYLHKIIECIVFCI
jgi:hypothetical protein